MSVNAPGWGFLEGIPSITSVVTFMNNAGTKVLEEVTVSSTSTVDVTCPDPITSGKITADELTIDSTIKYSYFLTSLHVLKC